MNQALPAAHAAFEAVREEHVDSLNLRVQEFRHRETGAVHYHLAADYSENVFLVALRTVPEDSTGVTIELIEPYPTSRGYRERR